MKIKNEEHYRRAKSIIQSHATLGRAWRAGIGDHWNWYAEEKEGKRLWDLTNDNDYQKLTQSHRTLYWSLNFFDDSLRGRRKEGDKSLGTLWDTVYYSLGVDIDTASGRDITEKEVTAAAQDCAQHFVDAFKDHRFCSYDVAFSGGGIYVIIHPMIAHFEPNSEEHTEYMQQRLLKYFNVWIQKKAEEFYQKYEPLKPIRELIKVDSLNSSKRQWKTLLSIHKSKPYAVVPMDKENPRISFEDATLPLSETVLNRASNWLTEYNVEDKSIFFEKILKQEVKEEEVVVKKKEIIGKELEIEPEKIEVKDSAPCIRNIFALEYMPKGGTRATTLVATFLGQAGWPEAEAYEIFKMLCKRFHVPETNRFESYFRKMHVPSCERLQQEGGGFPHVGMSDVHGICTPDEYCKKIKNPLDYSRNRKREAKTSTEERPRLEVPYFFDDSHQIFEVLTTDKKYKFAYLKNGKVVLADSVDLENGITITPRGLPTRQGKIYEIVKMPNEDVATAPLLEPDELFNRIKDHFQRYIDLPQNELGICVYYTLFTWFYQKTNTLGYLRFLADTGKGKTRMLEVVSDLCFYPVAIMGSSSFSGAMRTNEKWHGTMVIDESDFIGDKEHNVLKFLNHGFQKGKFYVLTDKKDPKRQEWFDPFSPKIIAMRAPFNDEATEGRTFSISPQETTNPDIPKLLGKIYEKETTELRNLILRFVLEHWSHVDGEKMIEFKDMQLDSRMIQLSMPITIIFQIWEDGITLFREYVVKRHKEKKKIDSLSWSGSLFNFVYAVAIGEEDLVEEFTGYYIPQIRKLQAVVPSMVARAFNTTAKTATLSLRNIGFEIERRYITYYKKLREGDIEERRKLVRAYVVPHEQAWKEMVRRYYYSEDESENINIPEILMSTQYKLPWSQTNLPSYDTCETYIHTESEKIKKENTQKQGANDVVTGGSAEANGLKEDSKKITLTKEQNIEVRIKKMVLEILSKYKKKVIVSNLVDDLYQKTGYPVGEIEACIQRLIRGQWIKEEKIDGKSVVSSIIDVQDVS